MITFKQFITEKKEEPPPFYNMHGSHSGPHKKRKKNKKKITEANSSEEDLYEKLVFHPTNVRNQENIRPKTERAFKDFSLPHGDTTDTEHEYFEKKPNAPDKDFSHLLSAGINSALIRKGTGGSHQIPLMSHMTETQHKEALGRADLISKEINRSAPLPHEATVYHGTRLDPHDHMQNGVLHSHGFMSTSSQREIAEDFAVSVHPAMKGTKPHIYKITLPKGHRALPMGFEHSYMPEESEILLNKGTRLKHIKSEQDGEYNIHHFEVHND